VATGGHAQPSAGDLCCTVGRYSKPLSDLEAASRPRPTADWESVCGSGASSPTTSLCRMIYLEAFSSLGLRGRARGRASCCSGFFEGRAANLAGEAANLADKAQKRITSETTRG